MTPGDAGSRIGRIRVLVVDDSVVVRRLVADALSEDPAIEVVGSAANGRLALAKVAQLAPDLVTMDVEMPEMNGIEAVCELRLRLNSRRTDWVEKSTPMLVCEHDVIAIESLNTKGMTRAPAPKADPDTPGTFLPVSYTHLTLPTNREVSISVVA